uniref:NADP-dependent oxidoreductase domain-containing protein n=1 Tax=Minutocellus polymorphus TaxID=265543 RepID=A0A7S0AW42_9STRA
MRRKNVAMSWNSSASWPAQDVGAGSAGMKPKSSSNGFATSSWIARILAVFFSLAGLVWHLHGRGDPHIGQEKKSNAKKKAEMGRLVFGTNKHFDKTAANVLQAIRDGGYTHIVSCGRHANYNEEGSGEGIRQALQGSAVSSREDLFLQTCFVADTNPDYDKTWSPATTSDTATSDLTISQKVRLSVESSLKNLNTTYLDVVLYHNLKSKIDPYEKIREAWSELEKFVDQGTVRYLGLTNVHDLDFLQRFHSDVRVKPTILQNRFHANRQFNVPLRSFIREHNLTWQAFWILTGNGGTVGGPVAKDIAKNYNVTPQQVIFAFVLSLGATPMIGSATAQHLRQDMDVTSELLSQEDRIRFAEALGKPDLVEM